MNSINDNDSCPEDLDAGNTFTYSWKQLLGEEVTIDVAAPSAEVSRFTTAGGYEFEITVSDDEATVIDTVTVEVLEKSINITLPPTDDDGGCGCAITEGTNGTAWLILLTIGGLPIQRGRIRGC